MTKTAIFFNGAAAYIAQEVAMLDVLMGHEGIFTGPKLDVANDVQLMAGLSSGALMTFISDLAFSEDYPLTWQEFKERILFTLQTDEIYTGDPNNLPYDTTPLKYLLTRVANENGVKQIKDLPFDSAIITAYSPIPFNIVSCWLTNIEKIAEQLPIGNDDPCLSIRNYHDVVNIVSALLCSTAIPFTFPEQNLYYYSDSSSGEHQPILDAEQKVAGFMDGGVSNNGAFGDFENFLDKYIETSPSFVPFDRLYIISPNYVAKGSGQTSEAILKRSLSGEKEERFDVGEFMKQATTDFLKKMQTYNADQKFAKEIFYTTTGVTGYDSLNFSNQEDQYNATIAWAKDHLEEIAVNINDLEFE